ncbi:MAG: VWA domain-containing protein, partial [Terriglobales bacterium]
MTVRRAMPCYVCIALCLTLVLVSLAQTAAEPEHVPSLSIRVNTRLVMLDVVATDKHGDPVLGLQASDFAVTEKGKPQKISIFSAPTPAVAGAMPPLPPGVYTNRPEYRYPGGSPTVIVLDAANTSLSTQGSGRRYMLRWIVDKYRPGDRVAIFSLTNHLDLLTDFTDDPQILLGVIRGYLVQKPAETIVSAAPIVPATMGGLAGRQEALVTAANQLASYDGERDYVMNRRADITIAAMRTLMRFLGGMPGRKNIIWLTASFPFSLFPEDLTGIDSSGSRWTDLQLARSGAGGLGSGLSAGQQLLYADKVRDIAAQFANAQVAIYPVDATGLTGDFSSNAVDRRMTMEQIASETGGRAFVNRNDLDRGVELAFADRAASYTLGYYPADKKWDGGYRKISIKVDRDGVELRHR